MLWQSQAAKIVVLLITCAAIVIGQSSPVTTCIEPFDWTINARNQTPCLVAAFLESACGRPTQIPPLPLNNYYQGPNSTLQNQCLCSSVTYSMISACAACQGRSYQNWTTWTNNCISTSLKTFPLTLPASVQVPTWAFLDVTQTNNTFDPTLAQAVLSDPNPTTSPSPSSTSATSTPISEGTPASISPIPTAAVEGKSKNHAGAIAGGVVGGLIFLALVGLGALWWFLRKKRNTLAAKDLTFDRRALVSGTISSQPTGSIMSPEMLSTNPYSSPLYGTSTDMQSTMPTSPVTSAVYTTVPAASRRSLESVSQSVAHFGALHSAQIRQPPGYTGAAEV